MIDTLAMLTVHMVDSLSSTSKSIQRQRNSSSSSSSKPQPWSGAATAAKQQLAEQADDGTDDTSICTTTVWTEDSDDSCQQLEDQSNIEVIEEFMNHSEERKYFHGMVRKAERELDTFAYKQVRFCPSKENDYFESDCTEEELLKCWYSNCDIKRFRKCMEQSARSLPPCIREGFLNAHQRASGKNDPVHSVHELVVRESKALSDIYYLDDSNTVHTLFALVGMERFVISSSSKPEDGSSSPRQSQVILDTAREQHLQESFGFAPQVKRSFDSILAAASQESSQASQRWAHTLAITRAEYLS